MNTEQTKNDEGEGAKSIQFNDYFWKGVTAIEAIFALAIVSKDLDYNNKSAGYFSLGLVFLFSISLVIDEFNVAISLKKLVNMILPSISLKYKNRFFAFFAAIILIWLPRWIEYFNNRPVEITYPIVFKTAEDDKLFPPGQIIEISSDNKIFRRDTTKIDAAINITTDKLLPFKFQINGDPFCSYPARPPKRGDWIVKFSKECIKYD